MTDQLTTPRLALPLLAAGQAQKEITHNEALLLIDQLAQPMAVAAAATVPPASPVSGDAWLLGAAPTGAWAGQPLALAIASDGGWRFVQLPVGSRVQVGAAGALWQRSASGWQPPATVAVPSGGATIDAGARAAIAAIIDVLRATGIVMT